MNDARHSCASSEWYSPPDIVERARRVLGEIDLDPASCEAANKVVKALWFYSLERDKNGLDLPWTGRVFCNPPSPPKEWWLKLVSSDCTGVFVAYSIEALAQSRGWGSSMARHIVCVPQRRIAFWCRRRDAIAAWLKREKYGEYDPREFSASFLAELAATIDDLRDQAKLEAWAKLDLDELVKGQQPTHASAIVGVRVDYGRFAEAFADMGDVMVSL
jgi:hypothetical protein